MSGRDNVVGTATRHEIDGQGIETVRGDIFRPHPDQPWGPPRSLQNGYRVSSTRLKRPGRRADYPHISNAEVKERVELYLQFPS